MLFDVNRNSVRFTGRWNMTEKNATTTATGGKIELAFDGSYAVLCFDINTNEHPFPHLWIRVDGGTKIEVPLDKELRIETKDSSNHFVEIIFKSAVETQHRWYEPLKAKVSFCGFEAEGEGILPVDERKIIEFIGDSITEGVLIDARENPDNLNMNRRVFEDDATATYAYLTAEMLNMKPVIMGYGAVGMTRSGNGAVPKPLLSYPYCYNNALYIDAKADIIVINHGANDRGATEETYIKTYEEFLSLVRSRNSNAKIVVLSPFCGVYSDALDEMVKNYNEKNNDRVLFVSTVGWIEPKPLHPLREGHRTVAEKLSKIIKNM